MRHLNFYISQSDIQISVDPADSDFASNLVHMEQLVGTLIKYGAPGAYRPFLAEAWQVSPDGLVWVFKLRDELHCEDGTEVSSDRYKEGLQLAFRNHAPDENTPAFSLLRGWKEFFDGSAMAIEGICTPDKRTLIFEFSAAPSGFEPYLCMPYFGFHCAENFDERGKWKDKRRIVASGAYKLRSIDLSGGLSEVQLELRTGWPLPFGDEAPERVSIKAVSRDFFAQAPEPHSMVQAYIDEADVVHPEWQAFNGPATISSNVVLNPTRGVFSDVSARRCFADVLRRRILRARDEFRWATASSVFYPFTAQAVPAAVLSPAHDFSFRAGENVMVEEFPVSNARGAFVLSLMQEAGREVGLQPVMVPINQIKMDRDQYYKKRLSELDIFSIGVAKGRRAEPWLNQMMFCSALGVRFPDPSGRICSLTEKYLGRSLNAEEYAAYGNEFERILVEDAAVIPVFHRGESWLCSEDIDFGQSSPVAAASDFLSIQLKK